MAIKTTKSWRMTTERSRQRLANAIPSYDRHAPNTRQQVGGDMRRYTTPSKSAWNRHGKLDRLVCANTNQIDNRYAISTSLCGFAEYCIGNVGLHMAGNQADVGFRHARGRHRVPFVHLHTRISAKWDSPQLSNCYKIIFNMNAVQHVQA